jgi:hypothetical protein
MARFSKVFFTTREFHIPSETKPAQRIGFFHVEAADIGDVNVICKPAICSARESITLFFSSIFIILSLLLYRMEDCHTDLGSI